MMKVVYDGPFDEVEILETGQLAKCAEVVDVADELGERLIAQDIWRKAERGLDYSVDSASPRGGKQ